MDENPRECWVHEWPSGERLAKLHPEDGTWTSRVSGVDESDLTFLAANQGFEDTPLGRAEARAAFHNWFDADTRFIVVSWGDHIESATFNRIPRYTKSAATIEVAGRGLRTFADERSTFGVDNYVAGDLTITNRTHAGAAAQIWTRLTQWTADWGFPVDLPVDAPGTYSRAIKRDEMATGESLFRAIEAQGYEIGFRPYFTPTYAVRWQMLVQPKIAIGAAIDVPLSVESPAANDIVITEDSSKRLTGVFYIGSGHGEATITAWAGDPQGRPIRDSFRYAKDILDQDALQKMANAAFAEQRNALEQWSLSVTVGNDFSPERAAAGRLLDVGISDDWWKEDGTTRLRIVSVRGSYTSTELDPEVQIYA